MIDKVLAATEFTDCNGCETPATTDPLHIDKHGAPFNESWQYDSIIGMLMYLAGNTGPDIAYTVHQAARFTHAPWRSHASGIQCILWYLQWRKREGLLLKPMKDFSVDCYADVEFGGLYGTEDKDNPVSVKS